jgi:hypothetical protein
MREWSFRLAVFIIAHYGINHTERIAVGDPARFRDDSRPKRAEISKPNFESESCHQLKSKPNASGLLLMIRCLWRGCGNRADPVESIEVCIQPVIGRFPPFAPALEHDERLAFE